MKYAVSLIIGMAVGAAALLLFLYYNPLTAQSALSPLSVSDKNIVSLHYSAVARDALVYTNNGESLVEPYPQRVVQLWEEAIEATEILVTVLSDSRRQPAGIGIKFSSDSEDTRLIKADVLKDSVWHIYLHGRGSLFVDQTENHWGYLREIVVPAYWSSADNWRGAWHGNVTAGPGALGTAKAYGGSGEFLGLETDAFESLTAKAFSMRQGPVAMDGRLTFEIPPLAE